jgi:hypothetical protein
LNITAEVQDSDGLSDSVSWIITVIDVNRAPTVYGGGPYDVDEDHGVMDMTVQLTPHFSDPEGDSLDYNWILKSGAGYGSLSDTSTNKPIFNAPPEVDSTVYVTYEVEVRDDYGGISTDNIDVIVNPYYELAHKYLPTLKFEDGDYALYFPVDCTFDGDMTTGNNKTNYNEVLDNPAEPVWVYIHEVERQGLTYIEYWYYYVYNNYFNNHYDDWELMIVVLDANDIPLKVRFGSHGIMRDCIPSEVEWDGTHPIAYVEEGSHAMDVDTGTFPGGWPFHDWEGVGYIAHWHVFKAQHTFLGKWYYNSGIMSKLEAGGYRYSGYITQEANDGWLPAIFGISPPWSDKAIWNNPTLNNY